MQPPAARRQTWAVRSSAITVLSGAVVFSLPAMIPATWVPWNETRGSRGKRPSGPDPGPGIERRQPARGQAGREAVEDDAEAARHPRFGDLAPEDADRSPLSSIEPRQVPARGRARDVELPRRAGRGAETPREIGLRQGRQAERDDHARAPGARGYVCRHGGDARDRQAAVRARKRLQ